MKCGDFDPRDIALGELAGPEREAAEAHLASCEHCRAAASEARLTVSAMRLSADREIPRRIAFVSDPVFELSWWQRFWRSGPQVGFASAAVLSCAILAHSLVPRPAPPATASAIEQLVVEEVARRLPAALDTALEGAVEARVRPLMASLERRVDDMDKTRMASAGQPSDTVRRGELKNIESAFNIIERRLAVLQTSAVRYGGGD